MNIGAVALISASTIPWPVSGFVLPGSKLCLLRM
jgi:hypothetical protein